jgi:CCR4-NOT transcription complex subunit 9
MNPNQQAYYQSQGYQGMQPTKSTQQTQPQINTIGMNINQYPNQMYQQQVQIQQQPQPNINYMPQQVGFNNNPYGYPGNFGTNISGPSSLNTSISTDYSDINGGEFEKVIEHIANLKYPEKREEALQELSKKRESFPKLAVYLWHSVGTLAILYTIQTVFDF